MLKLLPKPGLYKKQFWVAFLLLFTEPAMIACKTVKPYQRAFLNDDAMQADKSSGEKFTGAVHSYREAASGGGKGKTSGGCGCN